jgi:hypothetical protein
MVFLRPMMSPIRPTINDEMKAPISRIATIVPIWALDGSSKYWLNQKPLKRGISAGKEAWGVDGDVRDNTGHDSLIIPKKKHT